MENGEGRKRAIFSTVVTGDISEISPFSSFASFRMRRCEQIKDERAEPNSFGGVTVERGRRALSLNFGSQGVAEQGACKEQEAKGGNRRPNQSFRGKWKRCENRGYACMRVQSHPVCRRRVSSASIDVVETRHSSREGDGGEFVQLSFLERSNDVRNMEEEERAANEGILPPNWTWQKELSNETRRRRERRKESCRSPAGSAQLSSAPSKEMQPRAAADRIVSARAV